MSEYDKVRALLFDIFDKCAIVKAYLKVYFIVWTYGADKKEMEEKDVGTHA